MKEYIRPNVKITVFEIEDIITASGVITNASDLTGEDADMYEVYKNHSTVQNENVSVFTW